MTAVIAQARRFHVARRRRRLRSALLWLIVAGVSVGGGYWAFHTQSRHMYGPQPTGMPTYVAPVHVRLMR